MKKIILQKNLFIYLNILSFIMFCFSIIGAIAIDIEILFCLFISLLCTLLSFLFLLNRIEYDDNSIKFTLAFKKTKVNFKDFPNDIDYETGCLMLGDIIICTDVAQENAKEYGHSYEREICYLIVHGCLHLLGFDHMEEDDKVLMRAVEESVLKKYKITRNEE